MPRVITPGMQSALNSETSTFTTLIRVDPVKDAPSYGACMTNVPITYNHGDGTGAMTYSEIVGAQPSSLLTTSDLSVDNMENAGLLPEFDFPISEDDIRAGVYDFAEWTAYYVDYENPVTGSAVVLGHGTIGKVSIRADGLSFVQELFGLSKSLRQSIVERDSLTCRAIFGSQPIGTLGNAPTQRFPCGFDAEALLVPFTVTAVGLETNIQFTADDLGGSGGFGENELSPGMVFWRTGLNAGRSNEVEANTAGGEITLTFKSDFPISPGDEGDARPDCTKLARDANKGCARWWGSEWPLHNRAEPDIPLGDAGQLNTPGASVGPGLGGSVSEPFGDDEG